MKKLKLQVPMRWFDLDAFGHVNNVAVLRILEEARVKAFWQTEGQNQSELPETAVIDTTSSGTTVTVVARQEIEYLAPIPYYDQPLEIQMWFSKLGGASLEICYEVLPPSGVEPKLCYAKAATTIVLLDSKTLKPRKLSAAEKSAWSEFLGEAIEFRK